MRLFFLFQNKPAHGKTYNKACVTSKDSDKIVHQPRMAGVLCYLSLDSQETAEGTRDQRRFNQTVRICGLI